MYRPDLLILSGLGIGVLTALAITLRSALRWPRQRWLRFTVCMTFGLGLWFGALQAAYSGWHISARQASLAQTIAVSTNVTRSGSGESEFVSGQLGRMSWRAKVERWDDNDRAEAVAIGAFGGAIGFVLAGVRTPIAMYRDKRLRHARRCIQCGYLLQLEQQARCSECGLETAAGT